MVLATLAWSGPAHADLGDDVRRLIEQRAPLAKIAHGKPRLLERGDRVPLSIPPELLDPDSATCTTVSVLGVVGAHFAIRFSHFDPSAPSSAYPEASSAGTLEFTRCGTTKPYLSGLLLEMRSPRGVLETVISNASVPLPKLLEILPHRDPGNELPLGDPGPEPVLPSLNERLNRIALRARREAALSHDTATVQATEQGAGATPVNLLPGCHELSLLAAPARALGPAVDLDLELVDAESGARLAVDRAEDADAAVAVCVGSPVRGELRFIGAAPGASLTLAHLTWALPPGLPTRWGPEPRARLAHLAHTQKIRLSTAPIYSSLGVQGATELPLEVEPGACYTVLVAALRGDPRSLSISARADAPGETRRTAGDAQGSAVSFCAHGARHATLEVEGDGANLAWFLAVWESGRSSIGVRER